MTNRPEQLDDLSAYLDGELEPAERDRVERLLSADPRAKAVLEDLRVTTRLVGALPRAHAPTTLAEAVTARLERDALLDERAAATARRLVIYQWTRRFSVAAVLVIAATVGWHYWQTEPEIVTGPSPTAESRGAIPSESSNPKGAPITGSAKSGLAFDETRMKKGGSDSLVTADKGALGADAPWSNEAAIESKAQFTLLAETNRPATPLAKGGQFGGGAGAPVQVALVDASRQFVETPTLGNVEMELRRNALSNEMLQRAPVAEVARQVRVAGDAVATQQVEQTLLSFMNSNSIPNLQQESPSDPANPEQAFFVHQQPTDGGADDAESEVNYLVNVPESKAAELVALVNDAAFANDASVELEAGGNVWQRNAPSQQLAPRVAAQVAQADAIRMEPQRSGQVQTQEQHVDFAEKRDADVPAPPAPAAAQRRDETKARSADRDSKESDAAPGAQTSSPAMAKGAYKADAASGSETESPTRQSVGAPNAKAPGPRGGRAAQTGERETDAEAQTRPAQVQQSRAPAGAAPPPAQTVQRFGGGQGEQFITLAIRLQVAPGSQNTQRRQTPLRQSLRAPMPTESAPATQTGDAP